MITQSCLPLKNMLIPLLIWTYWSWDWKPSSAAQKHHPSKSKYRVSIIHYKTGRKKHYKLNNVKMQIEIFSVIKKNRKKHLKWPNLGASIDVCFAFITIFVCCNEMKSLWKSSLYETVILFSKWRKRQTFSCTADRMIEVHSGFLCFCKTFQRFVWGLQPSRILFSRQHKNTPCSKKK